MLPEKWINIDASFLVDSSTGDSSDKVRLMFNEVNGH
jgi:hypothetical protein